MDLKEDQILGDDITNHWYFQSKAKAMTQLLSRRRPLTALDVGAGSTFFSKYLLSNTALKEAWCVDTGYKVNSDVHDAGKSLYLRQQIGPMNVDVVLLMDVLEHVDDDVGLLQEYLEKVPAGTLFLITVPAFSFLWSGHDIFLEHKRRYNLKQLEEVVRNSGLKIISSSYYFAAVFPLAVITRIFGKYFSCRSEKVSSQLTRHHPLINLVLNKISDMELPLLSFNRLAGLTIFCLAEKR